MRDKYDSCDKNMIAVLNIYELDKIYCVQTSTKIINILIDHN